jgi:serine/threonine protein kinase
MQAMRETNVEPIPGYRLLEPLGKGGFGEVWKCEAPGGLLKAIKFVHGHGHDLDEDSPAAHQELSALQHIKTIRHPFLLSMERVEVVDGDLVIVMELADQSLHDLFRRRRAEGHPGIPRAELLRYLAEAAEVLDVMNQGHGLQHLDIKPQNLFLVGRHMKVADFGLVNSLAEFQNTGKSSVQQAAVTPVYASPEVFFGKFTLFSDQYSLAITYQELLTGGLPFNGKNFRQLAMLHIQSEPDLSSLPEEDRPVVARALAKEPRERFPSCLAFVQALEDALPEMIDRPHARVALGEVGVEATNNTEEVTHTERYETQAQFQSDSSLTADPENRLRNYRFLECLGRSAGMEVWRAQDRVGYRKLVKLLAGFDPQQLSRGCPWQRLAQLDHPTLLPCEVVPAGPGRLAAITDPAEQTLAERLRECLHEGMPGIPRLELLGYLREIAQTLDELYEEERLQHLSLSPRQVVLTEKGLRLLDFGFVELLWAPLGYSPATLNPRYAPPEMFQGEMHGTADIYSLALMFFELLTGVHPFRNLNPRQLSNRQLRGEPDLSLLTATDRPIIRKALRDDPERRFSTCVSLIEALEQASLDCVPPREAGKEGRNASHGRDTGQLGRARTSALRSVWNPETAQKVAALVEWAAQGGEVRAVGDLQYRLRGSGAGPRNEAPWIEHRCQGRVVPGTAELKLQGFCEQWNTTLMLRRSSESTGNGQAPLEHFSFQIPLPTGFLHRLLGRGPTLDVDVMLFPPRSSVEAAIPVVVTIQAMRMSKAKGEEALHEIGPELLRSVRNYLQIHSGAAQERYPFRETVEVVPRSGPMRGDAIVARGRDIGRSGMTLALPISLAGQHVSVRLPTPGTEGSFRVPATVERTTPSQEEGCYDTEIAFVLAPTPGT